MWKDTAEPTLRSRRFPDVASESAGELRAAAAYANCQPLRTMIPPWGRGEGVRLGGEGAEHAAGASRRDQILASALELFRSQGYDRTSLREISGRLGISKSGLYHHFEAKDDLISRLVGPLLDRIHEIAAAPPVETEQDLRAFLATYIDTFIENREVLSLLANDVGVRNHPRVSQRLAGVNDEIYRRITGIEPELGTSVRAAQVLIGLQGAIIRYAATDPEVVRDVCLRTALAALSSPNLSNR
jgi:AcrR family transcriptional regulator